MLRSWMMRGLILRSPDGVAGGGAAVAGFDGGGDADGKGAGGQAAGAAAAGQPGGQAAGEAGSSGDTRPYRPDGLPDHFAGGNDRETIDKLHGALTGFRQQAAERGAVPAAPDKYEIKLEGPLAARLPKLGADPAMKPLFEAFLDAGVTDKQAAKIVPGFLDRLEKAGMLAQPLDMQAEMAKIDANPAVAQQKLGANKAWIENATKNGGIDAEMAADLDLLLVTAAGNRVIDRLRQAAQAGGYVAAPGAGDQGGLVVPKTMAEATALAGDPRYSTRSDKYDAKFRADADRAIDAFNAAKAAS
jgi:hypothetical protein